MGILAVVGGPTFVGSHEETTRQYNQWMKATVVSDFLRASDSAVQKLERALKCASYPGVNDPWIGMCPDFPQAKINRKMREAFEIHREYDLAGLVDKLSPELRAEFEKAIEDNLTAARKCWGTRGPLTEEGEKRLTESHAAWKAYAAAFKINP